MYDRLGAADQLKELGDCGSRFQAIDPHHCIHLWHFKTVTDEDSALGKEDATNRIS